MSITDFRCVFLLRSLAPWHIYIFVIARFIQDTLITDLQTIGDFVLWETGTKLRGLKLYNYVAKHYALVPQICRVHVTISHVMTP